MEVLKKNQGASLLQISKMTHDLEMEDTAKELQDHAAKTQDTLVDAVENAEVAEIKRAVFRALTRLRAATIKEFDTIARLETQAIDAYNDAHHYRAENPLTHLHEGEAPVETMKPLVDKCCGRMRKRVVSLVNSASRIGRCAHVR